MNKARERDGEEYVYRLQEGVENDGNTNIHIQTH